MSALKTDPVARAMLAMLIRRTRDTKRFWLGADRTGLPTEFVAEFRAQYYALHNAAEDARRLLYACAGGTLPSRSWI